MRLGQVDCDVGALQDGDELALVLQGMDFIRASQGLPVEEDIWECRTASKAGEDDFQLLVITCKPS